MRNKTHCLATCVALAMLAAACNAQYSSDDRISDAHYLRRWKVKDASGNVLSQGCTKQSSPGPRYVMNVVDVSSAAGTLITYEDDLGGTFVEKSRGNKQLPTTDKYWCNDQDLVHSDTFPGTGFETARVADADPPATIESIGLINAHKDAGETWADGLRLRLRVQHPGVLHLGFSSANPDAGADAGTKLYNVYPAMTIK